MQLRSKFAYLPLKVIVPISDGPIMYTSLRGKLLGKKRLGDSEGIQVFTIIAFGRTILALERAKYAPIFCTI